MSWLVDFSADNIARSKICTIAAPGLCLCTRQLCTGGLAKIGKPYLPHISTHEMHGFFFSFCFTLVASCEYLGVRCSQQPPAVPHSPCTCIVFGCPLSVPSCLSSGLQFIPLHASWCPVRVGLVTHRVKVVPPSCILIYCYFLIFHGNKICSSACFCMRVILHSCLELLPFQPPPPLFFLIQ